MASLTHMAIPAHKVITLLKKKWTNKNEIYLIDVNRVYYKAMVKNVDKC